MNNNQLRHTLLYGSVSGGIMAFFFFMIHAFGRANNESLSSMVYSIYIIGAFVSVKHYRDREMGGFISFSTAFSTGFITCLVNGVFGGIYNYIQFKFLNPGMKEELIINMQEALLNSGAPDEKIELQTQILEQFLTAGTMAFSVILYAVIVGAIIALINAAILKRPENPLNNNQISNS